ncbi:MAG: HAD family hydrolase, partial [Erysipelotrichaceae bacterium]|nr:HAD family hydrolase [Erysipelotrichaceae bacterium]
FESMLQDLVLYDEYGNVGNKDQILRTFEQKYDVRINMSGKEFARWWIEHQYLFTVLFPDAMDTVLKLKEKYKIGILTNGAHLAQWGKIERSGLMPYVDAIVVSEDAGVRKPDVRIFEMMADKLGLKCEECVYVGDTFSLDIMGAYNSGMKPVWIWPSERAKPSDFDVARIRNVSDLLEIL